MSKSVSNMNIYSLHARLPGSPTDFLRSRVKTNQQISITKTSEKTNRLCATTYCYVFARFTWKPGNRIHITSLQSDTYRLCAWVLRGLWKKPTTLYNVISTAKTRETYWPRRTRARSTHVNQCFRLIIIIIISLSAAQTWWWWCCWQSKQNLGSCCTRVQLLRTCATI